MDGLYCETHSSAPTSSGRKDLDWVTELYEVLQQGIPEGYDEHNVWTSKSSNHCHSHAHHALLTPGYSRLDQKNEFAMQI